MAKRISAGELEKLIADNSVADETIARYLKPASVRGLPFEPMLTVDNATVEAPATRGIIGLTVAALNARSNRHRLAAYRKRIDDGWRGVKILAKGDSWFLYPILLRDVVDNLSDNYAIYSVAAAGDTLENMVRGAAHLEELINANGFDAMLLSAGGNDIAGDPLGSYLRELKGPPSKPTEFITERFDEFLATAKARIGGVVSRLTSRFPKLQIFGHGYDWPFPHSHGTWLEPAFLSRNVPAAARAPILKIMIDRYYGMLEEISAASNGRYHVVDCRGCVGAFDQWFDELHPLDPGFARVAGRFRDKINRALGLSRGEAAAAGARITWQPREDKSGTRTRTHVYPAGAVITVGRRPEREIVLNDEKVSRNHARLCVGADGVDVEDVGSSNGTFIAGKKIIKERWFPGQELRIGCFSFCLELEQALSQPAAHSRESVRPQHLGAPGKGDGGMEGSSGNAAPGQPFRQLEIVLSNGSISRQSASAWALGVFQNVNPLASRGPARAIDHHLDGLLSDVFESQAVDGRLGSVLPVPVPVERGAARNLFLVGLGAISEFLPKAVETAGESLARLLVATQILDLATVPIGASSGLSLKGVVESFLTGFLRGLHQSDATRGFRSLTLCEVKPDRYSELCARIQSLNVGGFLAARGFEVTVRQEELQQQTEASATSNIDATGAGTFPERTYYVEVANRAGTTFEYGLLGFSGAAAPCFTGAAAIPEPVKCAIEAASCPSFDAGLGKALTDAYMPASLQLALERQLAEEPGRVVIIHDAASAAVPWEASFIGGRSLALDIGVSRQHKPGTRFASFKKAPRKRRPADSRLRMLLVFDPTCDLGGAETEAHDLADLFSKSLL